MDIEDRDHFKTIASPSVVRRDGSQSSQNGANSASAPDQAYCLRMTRLMFSCYRKDEAHDPEIYCAAVAATLADFPRQVVDYVTDPRTGIPSESKFLPNVAEVRAACVREAERRRVLSQPKVILRRGYKPPVKAEPGTSYFEMFAKHGRPIGRFERDPQGTAAPAMSAKEMERVNRAYFERECRDAGIDPAGGVSPSLLKTLGEQDVIGD